MISRMGRSRTFGGLACSSTVVEEKPGLGRGLVGVGVATALVRDFLGLRVISKSWPSSEAGTLMVMEVLLSGVEGRAVAEDS